MNGLVQKSKIATAWGPGPRLRAPVGSIDKTPGGGKPPEAPE